MWLLTLIALIMEAFSCTDSSKFLLFNSSSFFLSNNDIFDTFYVKSEKNWTTKSFDIVTPPFTHLIASPPTNCTLFPSILNWDWSYKWPFMKQKIIFLIINCSKQSDLVIAIIFILSSVYILTLTACWLTNQEAELFWALKIKKVNLVRTAPKNKISMVQFRANKKR